MEELHFRVTVAEHRLFASEYKLFNKWSFFMGQTSAIEKMLL